MEIWKYFPPLQVGLMSMLVVTSVPVDIIVASSKTSHVPSLQMMTSLSGVKPALSHVYLTN